MTAQPTSRLRRPLTEAVHPARPSVTRSSSPEGVSKDSRAAERTAILTCLGAALVAGLFPYPATKVIVGAVMAVVFIALYALPAFFKPVPAAEARP